MGLFKKGKKDNNGNEDYIDPEGVKVRVKGNNVKDESGGNITNQAWEELKRNPKRWSIYIEEAKSRKTPQNQKGITINTRNGTYSIRYIKCEIKDSDIINFIEPSKESGEQYREATRLVNYADENEDNSEQYFIRISHTSKDENGLNITKTIQYVYESEDAYKNGKKPIIVYIDGIDKRTEQTGIFRLLSSGSYIDNKTFKIENGMSMYETTSIEEINELVGDISIEKIEDIMNKGIDR